MRRSATAIVVLAGVVAGCGVHTEDAPTTAADDDVPFSLLVSPTTVTTIPSSGSGAQVRVCFHDDADHVAAFPRSARSSSAVDAMRAYASGPSAEERSRGLSSALFDPALVADVTTAGGVARVELSSDFTDAGASTQLDIVVEIVCTFTTQPGIGQVSFDVDGQPIDVPRGDGSLAADPVSRDDYAALIR